jgi:hypothetical protein
MEGPTSKKTNEPPKMGGPQGNIKFLDWDPPLLLWEAYHIRKEEDLFKGHLV